MSGKLQRTYIAWHDAWVESSRELTEKHVLPPQVHMNVITCPTPPHPCIHAPTGSHRQACPSSASSHERYYMPHLTPPHPTRAYMHLPAATDKHVLPPQVHMNVITCPTPPHPAPPMCTKHNGLLKAVVQLYSRIFPDQILPGKRQTQVFRKTWVVLPKKVIFEIYSKFGPFGPFLPGTQSSAKLASLTRWCPLVINLFINPINHRYITYKP